MTFETIGQVVVVGIGVIVIVAILAAVRASQFRFMIVIQNAEPRVTKGSVPAEFLDHVREICREFHIATGWIGGVRRGKQIALRFSGHFPRNVQQRLRNMWFTP